MLERPDLLLLWSDQHAQSIAGCYGDPIVHTPRIDALAKQGVVFDNAYCPSPICLPSRMSTLTAREPHVQACWTNQDVLPSGIPTLAHGLGASGYRTSLIGRLHSLGPDQLRGFEHREIGDHSSNWIGGRSHDLGVLSKANDPYRESLRNSGPGQCAYELHDRDVTAAAVAHLRDLGERRQKGDRRPFATAVGWMLPHAPYVCDPELYRYYANKITPPRLSVPEDEHPYFAWWRENRSIADATHEEIMRARAAYYGLVDTLDRMVGAVLDALEGARLAKNTIVVYLSDHGEHLGNRGLWWKSTLYDEATKVPLVISGPELPSGRRSAIISLIDLTATLLELTGAPPLPNSQGRNFARVLRDPQAPWIDEAFSEYANDGAQAWSGGRTIIARMVRLGRYKLVYHHGYQPELFDLRVDENEQRNLAENPGYAAIRDALLARVLAGWEPAAIAGILDQRRREHDLLASWARAVNPPDHYRWQMRPDDNRLERAPSLAPPTTI